MLNVAKQNVLELSPCHIKPETYEWLIDDTNISMFHGFRDDKKNCLIPIYWLNRHKETIQNESIPNDLLNIIKFAEGYQCQFILIDADGISLDELPIFEW